MRKLLTTLALATCAALGSAPATAQSWPTKPVTVIVPFPAGGGTDAFARPLFAQLTKQLGQQVIVDNRGGAGGNIGATLASRAAPARLSTMTCWPSDWDSCTARMRAMMSVGPPGGKGTISVMVRSG